MADTELRAKLNQVLIDYGMGGEGSTETYELHSWRCYYPDLHGKCDCVTRFIDDLIKVVEAP